MKTLPSNPTPRRHRCHHHSPPGGFTLMELMVVMVIVSILAAIAIPALSHMMARAKAKIALHDAQQLKTGITTYHTEYRKYPTRDLTPDDGDRPAFSDHALMDILIPSDAEAAPGGLNPRRRGMVSFNNARPMGRGKYRSGVVVEEDGSGELWDPYGSYYRVVMDIDYNNRIPAPGFDDQSKAIVQSVIVWSAGPDQEDETVRDNIMTWRP